MPPKKNPEGASKLEESRKRDEINQREKELKLMIDAASKEAQQLADVKTSLVLRLAELDVELDELRRRNAQAISESASDARVARMSIAAQVHVAELRAGELESKLAAGKVLRDETIRLRAELAAAESAFSEEQRENREREQAMEASAFDLRMQLSEASRRTIKDLTGRSCAHRTV